MLASQRPVAATCADEAPPSVKHVAVWGAIRAVPTGVGKEDETALYERVRRFASELWREITD